MGESYMWYTGFDGAFNPLSPANAEPRAVVPKLRALLADLSKTWALEDIHLFGFGQGASAALALALSVASNPVNDARRLGSAVAVLGGLEGSTRKSEAHSNTPVLYYTRRAPDTEEKLVKDRFAEVTVFRAPAAGAMPANMDEWRPVMGFWGKVLKRDDSWKGGEVYEVVR
jgi:hypothetical protein